MRYHQEYLYLDFYQHSISVDLQSGQLTQVTNNTADINQTNTQYYYLIHKDFFLRFIFLRTMCTQKLHHRICEEEEGSTADGLSSTA